MSLISKLPSIIQSVLTELLGKLNRKCKNDTLISLRIMFKVIIYSCNKYI